MIVELTAELPLERSEGVVKAVGEKLPPKPPPGVPLEEGLRLGEAVPASRDAVEFEEDVGDAEPATEAVGEPPEEVPVAVPVARRVGVGQDVEEGDGTRGEALAQSETAEVREGEDDEEWQALAVPSWRGVCEREEVEQGVLNEEAEGLGEKDSCVLPVARGGVPDGLCREDCVTSTLEGLPESEPPKGAPKEADDTDVSEAVAVALGETLGEGEAVPPAPPLSSL